MAKTAQEIVKKDIADRLNKIAFHFEERSSLRSQLEQYTTGDNNPNSPNHKNMNHLVTRIQSEEVSTLYELVHLLDNVKKHFKICGLNNIELAVIEQFKLYKVAANFVNVHKHGTRGRNKPSAKMDYYALVHVRKGKKPGLEDKLIGVRSMINFEGTVFESMELIEGLIRIWELFLRHHTEIDIQPFISRIGAIFAQRQGQSIYSAKLSDGFLADAKRMASERKHMNL